MQAIEEQEKYRISNDLLPKEYASRRPVDNRSFTFERILNVRIDYFLALNRTSEAKVLIEQELAKLASKEPDKAAPAADQTRFRFRQNEWTRKLGRVAEKENRIEDALKLYQTSLKGLPAQALNDPRYGEVASIKSFYLAHGGTEEKWLEWAGAGDRTEPAPMAKRSLDFLQPVSEFAVKDLSGKLWRLEDLKGKGTFINFWATWCGPCRGEHPEIQKLHDRLKASSQMQVITFSVDNDPAQVMAYLREKGYTFPVIQSPVLANKIFPYMGLPSNVLVNASGRRTSLYGFGGGEVGLKRALEDLTMAAGESK